MLLDRRSGTRAGRPAAAGELAQPIPAGPPADADAMRNAGDHPHQGNLEATASAVAFLDVRRDIALAATGRCAHTRLHGSQIG